MAKFKYVGDPNDGFSGPDTVHQFGQVFKKGEVVDVPEKTDEDKFNVNKLRGHSHFVDMSDKEGRADVEERQKALEKLEKDKEKAEAEQRKRDTVEQRTQSEDHTKAGKTKS